MQRNDTARAAWPLSLSVEPSRRNRSLRPASSFSCSCAAADLTDGKMSDGGIR